MLSPHIKIQNPSPLLVLPNHRMCVMKAYH
jgi:hypothetical protein